MKRYSTTSIRCWEPAEDPEGEWVRYEEAQQLEKVIKALQDLVADMDKLRMMREKR